MNIEAIIDLIKRIEQRIENDHTLEYDTVDLLEESLRPLYHLLFLLEEEKVLNTNTAVVYCVEHE